MGSRRGGAATVLAAALVGGAGTMTVELAAVRLLAPWFGSSLVVWTNVIGVVLLALALGYALGGRLSVGARPLFWMGAALAGAALASALVPLCARPAARLFLPTGLALDSAAEIVLWGSLATALLLFLPPALLLGAVAPLAVESVQRLGGGTAGRAGGAVLAASTFGSLAGVFGTSHLMLPRFGLAGTFALAAGALAVAAGLVFATHSRARGVAVGAALILVAAGLANVPDAGPRLAPEQRLLAHAESPYQSLRVVEDASYAPPLRFLQVNEGFDSFQSVWSPEPGLLEDGFYYNDFVLPLWWERGRANWRVLVLGLGAGTSVRVLAGAAPETATLEWVGVELDPGVVTLTRELMPIASAEEEERGRVLSGVDGRLALEHLAGPWDLIVLDCYANQVEIPAHLATRELFAAVRERLAPGGWLVANVAGFGAEDPVVAAVAASAAAGFDDDVLLLRVPRARNWSLFARRAAPLPLDAGGQVLALEGSASGARDAQVLARLAQRLAPMDLTGSAVRLAPGDLALTDDRAPLEVLQLASLRAARELLTEGPEVSLEESPRDEQERR